MVGRKAWMCGAIGLLALLGAGWHLLTPELRLEVTDGQNGGRVLLSLPARAGQSFSIWFFHSYDRAFFEEHYRLEPSGKILLTNMTFKSSLNGEGFVLGAYRALPGGVGELAGINQEKDQVEFMLGSPDMANHTLITDGRKWRLLDYARTGDILHVRVVRKPRWRTLGEPPPPAGASLADAPVLDRG